jgi:RNA polymerase sigma factor (sigma-70 family)
MFSCRLWSAGLDPSVQTEYSLDARLFQNGKKTLADVYGADPRRALHRRIQRPQLRAILESALRQLSLPQQVVIRKRFGLWDGRQWNLVELAVQLGISKEGVRQRELAALEKLRGILAPQRASL